MTQRFISIVVALLISVSASAVDLQRASDRELFDEFEKRFVGIGTSADVFYSCSDASSLYITLVNNVGSTTYSSISINNCEAQRTELARKRPRVTATALVGLCSGIATLRVYALHPRPTVINVDIREMSTLDACLAEADRINSR